MSSTVQYLPLAADAITPRPAADETAGSHRGQGLLIMFGASVVLWAGIIAAVIGVVNLTQ